MPTAAAISLTEAAAAYSRPRIRSRLAIASAWTSSAAACAIRRRSRTSASASPSPPGASLVNLVVGDLLMTTGGRERSIVLEADGRHLMTDVWTSVGVIVGVAAVATTGWERLDAVVALAVAANIVYTGVGLMRRSAGGLMDRALSDPEQHEIDDVLDRFRADGVQFHALRTRRAGSRAFMSLHIVVPGGWTVRRGHDLAERIEAKLRERLAYATGLDPSRAG